MVLTVFCMVCSPWENYSVVDCSSYPCRDNGITKYPTFKWFDGFAYHSDVTVDDVFDYVDTSNSTCSFQSKWKPVSVSFTEHNRSCGIISSSPFPYKDWESLNIHDFMSTHVNHNKTKMQLFKDPPKLLWGPSDRDSSGYPRCLPRNVSESFGCKHNMPVSIGLGGKYAGLPFHQHSEVYNHLVYGEKVWYLFPDTYNLAMTEQSNLMSIRDMLRTGAKPIVCVQKEGDVIRIPSGYWHATVNREVSFSIGCSSMLEL